MPPPSEAAVRTQLQKILSSPGFQRNDRLSGFLRFVVDQELSGKGPQLKESIVGVEVFGRSPDYDVRLDSVVRTEAAKLRDRAAKYYAKEGSQDAVVIDMPKGGYRPTFGCKNAIEPAPVLGRRRVQLWVPAAAVVLLAMLFTGWRLFLYRPPAIPIAVLPLLNLSQGTDNEYFADGLTTEIIRDLAILDGLVVRSQTSSFAFKGKARNSDGKIQDIHEIGRELDVDYVLEGTVLRSGQQLRIDTQLVRVRDDLPVWSGRYDRQLTDIFVIQDEISRGIVNSLRLKLGRGRRRYETSMEAYDLYLQARAKLTLPSATGMRESIEPFEQAIAKDPSFAPAYAGLASARAAVSGFDSFNYSNRQDDLKRMREAAAKAVELDPLLAEAYGALAVVQARDGQWDASEKSFRRSLELDPNDAELRTDFAIRLLLPIGRMQDAIAQIRIASKMEPVSEDIQAAAVLILRDAGRYEEAATHCLRKAGCLADKLFDEGRYDEAIRILEPIFVGHELKAGAGALGAAYARAGRREDAEKLVAMFPRPLEQAIVFAAMPDKERTIDALERAAALGPERIGRSLARRDMDFVRDDPRVRALRQKVGLPSPW